MRLLEFQGLRRDEQKYILYWKGKKCFVWIDVFL